jgi:hypothetical protein
MKRMCVFSLCAVLGGVFGVLLFADPAFAYYHPSLGKWISRDPERYADGLNMYAYARAQPINFCDPSGLRVDILEVSPAQPGKDTPQFADTSQETFKEYFAYVDSMIAALQSITDEEFNQIKTEGSVTFAGKAFEGTRQEYIDRLVREKTSTHRTMQSGGREGLLKESKALIAKNTMDYDQTVISAHGEYIDRGTANPPEPTGKVVVTGERVNQASLLKEVEGQGSPVGGSPRFLTVSCYRDGKRGESWHGEGGAWEVSSSKCVISFQVFTVTRVVEKSDEETNPEQQQPSEPENHD